MSKAKNHHYPLMVRFNNYDLVGAVDIIQNVRTGLSDKVLSNMVIAPSFHVKDDGTVKIVGWSLINNTQKKGGDHGGTEKRHIDS